MNLLSPGRDKKVSAFWRRKIWCRGIKKHALSGPGEKWIEEDRGGGKIDKFFCFSPCVRYCFEHCTFLNLFNPYTNSEGGGTIIESILQMKKLGLRDVKWLAQGCTAGKTQSWDWSLGAGAVCLRY